MLYIPDSARIYVRWRDPVALRLAAIECFTSLEIGQQCWYSGLTIYRQETGLYRLHYGKHIKLSFHEAVELVVNEYFDL